MSPDFTAEVLYFGCGERQWFLVLLPIGPISLHDIYNLLGYHGYITDVPPLFRFGQEGLKQEFKLCDLPLCAEERVSTIHPGAP